MIENEPIIRLASFLFLVVLFSAFEFFRDRKLSQEREVKSPNWPIRWINNYILSVCSVVLVKVIFPLGLVSFAAFVYEQKIGLLAIVEIPYTLSVVISFLILDLIIYWQHRIFHKAPLLWRLHQVHHLDDRIDVSTGVRFHPLEILLSLMLKFGVVFLLGAPAVAVFLFELFLSSMALFTHASIRLHSGLDRMLRVFFVTPKMHYTHHSKIVGKMNQNFGFGLSVWDRLFKSYYGGDEVYDEDVGLDMDGQKPASTLWCLALPFRQKT